MSQKARFCCVIVWVLVWVLGIILSWVYKGSYSDEADSTKDLALAGAILYTLSIFTLLKEAANSGVKMNNDDDFCSRCSNTLAILAAFVGGFVLPLVAGILMAVGAARTSDMKGKVIASMAAGCDFLSLPINCMVWAIAMSDYQRL